MGVDMFAKMRAAEGKGKMPKPKGVGSVGKKIAKMATAVPKPKSKR
jgi:hypothetical protein